MCNNWHVCHFLWQLKINEDLGKKNKMLFREKSGFWK